MRSIVRMAAMAAAVSASVGLLIVPAEAACTRLGFSVNDYGKDGPTKDAKELLDKYIAKKMSEKGIAKYTTGKKDVKCELFLNFIVFDEHTCRAEATVCWDGAPLPKSETVAGQADADKPVAKKPAAPKAAAAAKPEAAKIETSSTAKAAEPAKAAAEKAAPAAATPPKAAQ